MPAILIAGWRLYHCTQLPVNSGDLLRQLCYGLLVSQEGLGAAGKTLTDHHESLANVPWADLVYNYPVIPLLFFTATAKLWPCLFFSKLVLTVIEAMNAVLVYRYTKEKWLALLYWASPISIWWVSREGQFEPLQNLFVLASLCLLKKRPGVAAALLTIGIQVKVTAIFMIPFMLGTIAPDQRKRAAIGAAAGCMPTAVAMLYFPTVQQVTSTLGTLTINSYALNPFGEGTYGLTPMWLGVINQVVSFTLLAALIVYGTRGSGKPSERLLSALPALLFTLFCKASKLCQNWYFLLAPSFLMALKDRRLRLVLIAALPLIDLQSTIQLMGGSVGYVLGDYFRGIDAFFWFEY